ncbi:GNA1162 family protein [Thermodesulfobacteriota bacterium]
MNKVLNRRLYLLMGLLMLPVTFFGCAHYQGDGSMTIIIATSEAFNSFDGEYENSDYFKHHKPESIAVLPFSSLDEKLFTLDSGFEYPEDVVRRGLYNHISSLPFKDMELFQTDTLLKNAGLLKTETIQQLIETNPKKLKSILGVDAAVTGDVTHFDRIYAGVYSQVAVGCEVKMWDLNTGKLLWRAKHVSRAHAGGLSLNPLGILLSAAASVLNMRDTEMLSQTDETFREIVSTIDMPTTGLVSQQAPPRIDLFSAMNTGRPFTAGKEISFRLVGDPECKAYVDLGDYRSAIQLEPVSPATKQTISEEVMASIREKYNSSGQDVTNELAAELKKGLASREIYEGIYMISPGEERYGLTSKAYLVNSPGDQGNRIDVAHTIDIDARPPEAPSGLSSEALNRKVRLSWSSNREKDLKGYQIWTSPSPISGYQLVKLSEKNDNLLEDLPNFDPVYIKIRAVDRADNTSAFSHQMSSVPLPEPGLHDLPQPDTSLGGIIDDNVLLVRVKSPYDITADIYVKPGATLYVEPGVEIRLSPDTALVIAGGSFVAYGEKSRPVRLVPTVFNAPPGSWKGLVLDHAARVRLNHVTILNAATGMTIIDSAPEIVAATIRGCSQAGLHLKSGARPNITCTTFASNGGQGALVIEGEGVSPLIRHSNFIHNEPFQVQSYAPMAMDLSENYWGDPVPDTNRFLGDIVWEPALPAPSDVCLDTE